MKSKSKTAAVLTIHRAGDMTPAGRQQIALWLRRQAAALVREGRSYARRMRARYLYAARDGAGDGL